VARQLPAPAGHPGAITRAEALRWWRAGYDAGHQAAARHQQATTQWDRLVASYRAQRAASQQASLDALLTEIIAALAGLFPSPGHPRQPDSPQGGTMNAAAIPATRLATLLASTADGITADTAAIELITRHDCFLHRAGFRRLITASPAPASGQPTAVIRWQAVMHALETGRLPCSSSEEAILRIAASIGDPAIAVRLRTVLGSLDQRNITLITTTITRANS